MRSRSSSVARANGVTPHLQNQQCQIGILSHRLVKGLSYPAPTAPQFTPRSIWPRLRVLPGAPECTAPASSGWTTSRPSSARAALSPTRALWPENSSPRPAALAARPQAVLDLLCRQAEDRLLFRRVLRTDRPKCYSRGSLSAKRKLTWIHPSTCCQQVNVGAGSTGIPQLALFPTGPRKSCRVCHDSS